MIKNQQEERLEVLNNEMELLKLQLPQIRYRLTKSFSILPGYKIENSFQYPDMVSLMDDEAKRDMHVLQLGLRQFSMVAQFGDLQPMKTGVDEELALNSLSMTLDQSSSAPRKIEFTWKQYETADSVLFFHRFRFLDSSGKVLASVQNLSDQRFQRAVTRDGFKFVRK